ncbi:MAG: hypothetical protein QF552_04320 [Litorilituus sp.]|nr:hypothetical protein [Litorilituus sp.]
MCSLVILSKYTSTKNTMVLAKSFKQCMLDIFTSLSSFYVQQPHDKASTLYKYKIIRCKSNFERATAAKWTKYFNNVVTFNPNS